MSRAKNVGLVTWLSTGNYGTSLQCYALYEAIKRSGFECNLLLHQPSVSKLSLLKEKAVSLFRRNRSQKARLAGVDEIRRQKLLKHQSRCPIMRCSSERDKRQINREFGIFCAGSDQIWNTWISYNPFNFLEFVSDDNRRISYATSIGTYGINPAYAKRVQSALSKFKYISVREKSAQLLLSELLPEQQISRVLDPTFLISADEWRSFAGESDIAAQEGDYIFSYFVGNREEYSSQLSSIAHEHGIRRIVNIPSLESPHALSPGSGIESVAGCGEADFVYLIDRSALVCTDSYHAIALSINLGKPFIAFKRFDDNDPRSQNPRVYDLLDLFGLKVRLYDASSSVCHSPIDFGAVDGILKRERANSANYLNKALND